MSRFFVGKIKTALKSNRFLLTDRLLYLQIPSVNGFFYWVVIPILAFGPNGKCK